MTANDYAVLLMVSVPLCGKVCVDLAALLAARKHNALANIFAMAGRQAATVARALSNLPPGADIDIKAMERVLINNASAAIGSEMSASLAVVKANDAQVASIVQGELDKLVVAPIPIVPQPAPVAPQPSR